MAPRLEGKVSGRKMRSLPTQNAACRVAHHVTRRFNYGLPVRKVGARVYVDMDWRWNGVAGAVWVGIKYHILASNAEAVASDPDGAVELLTRSSWPSCASNSDRRVVRHWLHRNSMNFGAILIDSG